MEDFENDWQEELHFRIDDDYKSTDFFDVEENYRDYFSDKLLNTVRLSVMCKSDIIAYLELYLFFDEKIKETGSNPVAVADDSLSDDSYEAMRILEKQGFFNRDESSNLFYLLSSRPISTVYIRRIAVREDYRGKGIGGWLLQNLRDVMEINFAVIPGVAIVKVYPEKITWHGGVPTFGTDEMADTDFTEMVGILEKLFESKGFVRYEDTPFFIRDYAK